jgi:hypothetical protein
MSSYFQMMRSVRHKAIYTAKRPKLEVKKMSGFEIYKQFGERPDRIRVRGVYQYYCLQLTIWAYHNNFFINSLEDAFGLVCHFYWL